MLYEILLFHEEHILDQQIHISIEMQLIELQPQIVFMYNQRAPQHFYILQIRIFDSHHEIPLD